MKIMIYIVFDTCTMNLINLLLWAIGVPTDHLLLKWRTAPGLHCSFIKLKLTVNLIYYSEILWL